MNICFWHFCSYTLNSSWMFVFYGISVSYGNFRWEHNALFYCHYSFQKNDRTYLILVPRVFHQLSKYLNHLFRWFIYQKKQKAILNWVVKYILGSVGLPWWIHLQCRIPGFNPKVGKTPWRRTWQPLQYSFLGNPPG